MPDLSPKKSIWTDFELSMLRYRLVHLIYAVTLLATSLGTFGAMGIGPGVSFLFFWAVVYGHASRRKGLLVAGGLVLVGCVCSGFLLPAVRFAGEAARRMHCSNNVKQIALALHNYHDVYKCFPPAYVPDDNGKPKHSWRVLILPYMEQSALYDAYNFEEPWDGPNNSKLLAPMPSGYSCPSQDWRTQTPNTFTNYVAVIGPSTAWPGSVGKKLGEFVDATSDSVLLLEVPCGDVQWMEPRDYTVDEALKLVKSSLDQDVGGHRYEDFFRVYSVGRTVAMADGSVHFLVDGSLSGDVWSHLLAINDGVPLGVDDLTPARRASQLKVGNIIRLSIWIVVVLFPLPWVWLGPYGTRRRHSFHGRRAGDVK